MTRPYDPQYPRVTRVRARHRAVAGFISSTLGLAASVVLLWFIISIVASSCGG